MADLVRENEGVAAAVASRAPDVRDLVWMRRGDAFELAVEAAIPEHLRRRKNGSYARVRYEVRVGLQPETREINLLAESLWLKPEPTAAETRSVLQRELFPMPPPAPSTIVTSAGKHAPAGWRRILNKVPGSGNDYFRSEFVRLEQPVSSGAAALGPG